MLARSELKDTTHPINNVVRWRALVRAEPQQSRSIGRFTLEFSAALKQNLDRTMNGVATEQCVGA